MLTPYREPTTTTNPFEPSPISAPPPATNVRSPNTAPMEFQPPNPVSRDVIVFFKYDTDAQQTVYSIDCLSSPSYTGSESHILALSRPMDPLNGEWADLEAIPPCVLNNIQTAEIDEAWDESIFLLSEGKCRKCILPGLKHISFFSSDDAFFTGDHGIEIHDIPVAELATADYALLTEQVEDVLGILMDDVKLLLAAGVELAFKCEFYVERTHEADAILLWDKGGMMLHNILYMG